MIGCLSFNSLGGQSDISIHTSVKEAAGNVPGKGSPPYIFQSMPPRRRRPGYRFFYSIDDISIHASAKEATIFINGYLTGKRISIHASAKEATPMASNMCSAIVFQSTPPRRRRPQHIVIPQLSCTYLVSTTFLSTIFSFISQYVVLFFLF